MTSRKATSFWIDNILRRVVIGVLAGPPCETWSAARYLPEGLLLAVLRAVLPDLIDIARSPAWLAGSDLPFWTFCCLAGSTTYRHWGDAVRATRSERSGHVPQRPCQGPLRFQPLHHQRLRQGSDPLGELSASPWNVIVVKLGACQIRISYVTCLFYKVLQSGSGAFFDRIRLFSL